jgi:hypothetical protein
LEALSAPQLTKGRRKAALLFCGRPLAGARPNETIAGASRRAVADERNTCQAQRNTGRIDELHALAH